MKGKKGFGKKKMGLGGGGVTDTHKRKKKTSDKKVIQINNFTKKIFFVWFLHTKYFLATILEP